MRHTYECPIRWADLDLLGHVNNVAYVDYLQEARVDMLRALGAPERSADPGEGLVVVRHELTYLAPLDFDFVPVSIECWVTEIRAASFTVAYEVFHEQPAADSGDGAGAGSGPGPVRAVYLRATTVLTPFVFLSERPRRLNDDERVLLQRFFEPAERTPRIARTPAVRSDVGHYPVQVRFSDVDVFGHVNNVKYLEYFQEARIVMHARLWADAIAAGEARPAAVIAQVDVDYRVPLVFREQTYDLWSTIVYVGTRSMVVESEIVDGGVQLARARVVVVFFDLDTGRSTEPSPRIRAALLAAQAAGAGVASDG